MVWHFFICRFFFKHVVYMEPLHTFYALGEKKLFSLCLCSASFLPGVSQEETFFCLSKDRCSYHLKSTLCLHTLL